MLLHIALNFDIKKATNNDDIEAQINNSPQPPSVPEQGEQTKPELAEAPAEGEPAPEEGKQEPAPVTDENAAPEEAKQTTPPQKPLMMQPCLKKKSSKLSNS